MILLVIDDRARILGQYDFIFDLIPQNSKEYESKMDKALVELFVCC